MNASAIRTQILDRASRSASFRARLLEDAAAAIKEETGVSVPKGFSVAAQEDDAQGLQLTVSGATSLSDAELANIVGGSGSVEGEEGESWAEAVQQYLEEEGSSE